MHVKYSSSLTKLIVGTAFFFLFILLSLTMTDYLSRGWQVYSGGAAGAGYGVRTPTKPGTPRPAAGEGAAPAH
jgi:hypothetical protein